MIRRDSTQDAERPHYYSQYWLDVAAGRPTGLGRVVEAEPGADEDDDIDAFVEPPRPEVRPVKKAAEPKRESPRSLSSLADLANIDILMNRSAEMQDEALTDIGVSADEAPQDTAATDLPDLEIEDEEALAPADEGDEFDEDFVDDEEEEPDEGWGGNRKGKKQPPKPQRRRDPRQRF